MTVVAESVGPKARQVEIAHDAVAHPITSRALGPSTASPWQMRARQVSRSAARAVATLPEVITAQIGITGTPDEPILTMDCTVRPGRGPAIIERLTHTVVQDLEDLLQTEFVERHIGIQTRLSETQDTPALEEAS